MSMQITYKRNESTVFTSNAEYSESTILFTQTQIGTAS
jgi:hypothetical protein